MHPRNQTAFRPVVERAEARILATVAPHAAMIDAASASQSQAWVEIVNRTDHALTFGLSANAGSTFHTYQLRAHSEADYHADHADSTILIKTAGAPVTALATSTTLRGAPAYSIRAGASITPGPDFKGQGTGGAVGSSSNAARFSLLNQTSKSSGSGGVPVAIQFSVDGGKTYPLQDTVPYTGGLVARPETIYYGNQGIRYRLPANPAIGSPPLTSLGQYYLFSNTSFQPYLSPTS